MSAAGTPISLNFENPSDEPAWYSVNDGVMGGLSRGEPKVEDGLLHFRGVLSLENNGGFSSIRTANQRWDFTGQTGIRVRVFGDGRTYQLRLSTDARYRGSLISYRADFATKENAWTEVTLPFADFRPGWRGRNLSGPPLDLGNISELGILLGDKNPGPFALKVDWIRTEARL